MRRSSMVPVGCTLLLLSLSADKTAPAAAAERSAAGQLRPVLAVWDTGRPAAQPLTPAALAAQDGWTRMPARNTPASFQGDAVLSNGRLLVVVRKDGAAAEVYGVSPGGASPRLRLRLEAPGGDPAVRLDRMALTENSRAAVGLATFSKTARGADLAATFRLKRGEVIVQTEPGPGADRLHVECPSRFVVLPDFFADDILIDAQHTPPGKVEVPSENFLVHLTGHGDAVAVSVFENRKHDVVVNLTEAPGRRTIAASEIPFEGKKVWVAVMEAPGVWHALDVAERDAGTILPLDWKMPFPAQWRLDLTRRDGLTDSWEMLLQDGKDGYVKPSLLGSGEDHLGANRHRWNTVLGSFPYPCWTDASGHGYLQPLKHRALAFQGPAVLYPLNRVKQTPLDAYTVVDIMRNTLGVGPCEHLLDLEGQKDEYRGRATCAVRDALGKIYGSKEQKAKRAEVEKILDDGLIFVTHIRSRITGYVTFGHQLRQYLAEQKKAHPELSAFIDEMDRITREIDARVAARRDKIQTPAHVASMNEAFRKNVLDYDGPDALERCQAYSTALVVIGDNQDELSGECSWVVKSLRQRAALGMARDPRVAPIAEEIRARAQGALRSPSTHESTRH